MKSKLKGKYIYIGMMFFLMCFFNINTLFAASAVLSWNPPTTNADGTPLTDLKEYCVHYGTAPGSYTESINVGNVLTYQVNNLSEGVTYYFAATALDTSGNESDYSIEVSRTIPSSDTTPPVISGVQATNVTNSSVAVSWTTSEASDTQIEYGSSTSYGSTTTLSSSMVTSHNQNINGLSSSTLYHYRVHSRDVAGNLAVSGDYTFTTAAPPACLLDARFEGDTLMQGMYYYTDRTYTLTGVPAQYLGLPMIKTPNSEQGLTDASGYMTFELTSPATVYVAYDSRGAGSLPAWMNGFTYTGNDIQTSLSTQPSLMVYGRQFTAGCIDFGANMTSSASGYYSNYIVFYDDGPVTYDYYCDDDGDGYIGAQSDGSCTGIGCEPAGCQTIPGNDCNDNNPAINQNAADDTCNGIDDNCDGTPDNNYVMSIVTCGTGVCTSTGQIVCQSGTEVNTCATGIPPENPERTCNDGLDNDCDGQVDEGCFPDIMVSNVLLSEDFSSGIPDTWSAHGAWSADNSCGKTIGYPFVGSFALVDSSCTTTGVDELVTEPLDASSCSSVELVYSNQYYWYSGNIELDVSSDGGTTWSNNIRIGSDDGYPAPVWKAIDISSLADAVDGQIKFRYSNSSFDGFWALDNVWVTCQSHQMDFSTQSQTSSKIIMITNAGKVDLAINKIDVAGQDASEFIIGGSDNCSSQTLMAGETCTFDVLFVPISNGSKNAILSISSNDPDTPTSNLSLTGTGTDIINPLPEIKVNGSGEHIVLPRGAKASVTIDLDAGSHNGREGDWWLLMEYRKRWYYYDESSGKWRRGHSFYRQGQLDSTGPIEIPESSKLQTGLYTFQFGVDLHKNGNQDSDRYYFKTVTVDVQ